MKPCVGHGRMRCVLAMLLCVGVAVATSKVVPPTKPTNTCLFVLIMLLVCVSVIEAHQLELEKLTDTHERQVE